MLAREIDRDPKVLIAAQPTRGLDVGAIEFVHRRLIAERDEGRGILLVSLELEEIFALADRILVMFEGEIVARVLARRLGEHARARDDRHHPGGARRHDRGGRSPAAGEPGPPPVAQTGPDDKKRFNTQGLIVSIITTTIAFLVGGLVVLATGHNPFGTYRAIFNGTGLTWLIPGYGDRGGRGDEPPADAARSRRR